MFEGTKRALADLHPIDPALKHNEWDLAKALQELVKDLEREISALDSRVSKLSRRLDECPGVGASARLPTSKH